MQALYRKYRSKSLAEVVGQEHITDTLAHALQAGRISHAYLFTGPRGVGKTSVARILAHEINKLPYSDTPQLDIIEIDAASNRRIDDIRDLRDKVHIAPIAAPYKVYIIDEVHMLTGESFNALLKTLEEPPAHVVFILATTEVHKLPATIISRTQRYSFRPVEMPQVIAHLKYIAGQEKIQVDDEALQLIAEHGEGSFRDSISLLDQLANISGGTITAQTVEQTLGLAPKAAIAKLLGALQQADHQAVAAQLTQLQQHGTTAAALLPQLLHALQAAAPNAPNLYGLIDQLLEVPKAYNPQIKLLTTLVSFTLHGKPSAKAAAPAVAQATKPVLEVTAPIVKPASKKEPSQVVAHEEPATPETTEATSDNPLTEITTEQWATALAALKEISAPLQSVFRQAAPNFDSAKQQLTLQFKYQLHRKRAEDAKAKSALTKAFSKALGSAPLIITELAGDAQPPKLPEVTSLPAPLDPAAEAVASLMGGGEAVTA